MPDISQPNGAIYDSDEAPPSWQDLREGGDILIDDPQQKLAVYTGDLGAVVLASQEQDDPVIRFFVMDHAFIPALVSKLTKAQAEAAEITVNLEAQYAAYEALEQKGGA